MMRLYLVRHGEALSEQEDAARPLSKQGKEEVSRLAQFLKGKGMAMQTIFHSGKKLAEQTAQILQKALNTRVQFVAKDYLAPNDSTDNFIYQLSVWNEDLMVVGHLPFLSKCVSRLIIGSEEKSLIHFPAGAVIALERDPNHIWQMAWFITPQML